MAHLPVSRESFCAWVRYLRTQQARARGGWRHRVPADCALCGGAAQGACLCQPCVDLVTESLRSAQPRCPRCLLFLEVESHTCPDCATATPAFDRIIAAFDYHAPGDALIHRFKVARRFNEAPMLGGLLADAVQRAWPDLPADLVLVPVPSGKQAILRRGFNPAAEVARVLARHLDRPCCPRLVRRAQEGPKQATLGRSERMMSASRLYQAGLDAAGLHIAVVDDVLTTGSTLQAIAAILKRSGAASVHGLVLARTQRASFPYS